MTKCYLPQHHPTKQWTIKSTIHVLIVVLVLKHFVVDGGGVEGVEQYSHQWAAHIVGGNSVVDEIARKHDFINQGEIFPDYYHLVHRKVAKRSTKAHAVVHDRLSQEPEVRWAEQQKVKRRTKRDFLSVSLGVRDMQSKAVKKTKAFTFNDPRWSQMWYLNRGGGLDMNVIEAWNEGVTGKGIVVTILDDGLEKDHPDIIRNYDPLASFDVNNLDTDPSPSYDLTDSNRHGTRCAGEVAAEANNSICSVGIAYEAGIGGVRMLDGDVTDAVEARSLSHNPQHIDIYSASWGPDDDGKTVDGPGELATRAFKEGVTRGRNGRGSIFIWASGNGGRDHDNCNCDGYTNSIWTLSISSATENGLVPWYSEACSSTLATTYSSGGPKEKQIVTIDLHHSCTQSHTGTSASAPLAAGICALALQANTNLTWRDMQHIVVRTARPNNLIASDWATNGVGRKVSHSFGYGLMDAGAMVKLAKKWINVPEQHKCEIKAPYLDKKIPAKDKVSVDIIVTDCPNVLFLEHVQAKVTLTSGRRGDLQISLVSPSGTRSVLLAHRGHDLNRSGFTDWPFMTVHDWGESPIGKWTLEIYNEGRFSGKLLSWSLIAHGIENNPNGQDGSKSNELSREPPNIGSTAHSYGILDGSENSISNPANHDINSQQQIVAGSSMLSSDCAKISKHGQCVECSLGFALLNGVCMTSCPSEGYFSRGFHSQLPSKSSPQSLLTYVCDPCDYSCRRCSGPGSNHCLSCYEDATLRINTTDGQSYDAHCYSSKLLEYIDSNNIWYKLLIASLIVNVTVVAAFICCVCFRIYNRDSLRSVKESHKPWFHTNLLYTRISPEENPPSGDEFENNEDDESESEEILTPYNGRDKLILEPGSQKR